MNTAVKNKKMVMEADINEAEVKLLLQTVYDRYGYDFREYSKAHIQRRIIHRLILSNIHNISEMQYFVLHDEEFAAQLIQDLSITVSEMFRDPDFYKSLRKNVFPILRTYPFIKIWHAGCATGEEAYSMAIMLKEENLYDRTTIYATDFNQCVLDSGKEGIFPNELIKEYTSNYQKSGGQESFSTYYTSKYNLAIMDQSLKKNIVWGNHNLVTDYVFAEVHLILCRNVFIYFNKDLQNKVHQLFFNSLVNGGMLCMGAKESLKFCDFTYHYTELDKKHKIFKKKY